MARLQLDFRRVAAAALQALPSLVAEWLPDGRRDGHEYKALNPTRADGKLGSFSINLSTGAWGDFATGDKGGDAISLYAYLNSVSQGDAARAIATQLGVADGSAASAARDEGAPTSHRRTEWVPVLPVPNDAPPAPKAHIKRGRPEATWSYRDREGRLLGVIYRFKTSDGGKEVLPCMYAKHATTHAREWRWLAFPQPRPLYKLDALGDELPVLIVEGEKCADAAATLLADKFAVVTWPGGSKAVAKADWTSLAGRKVLIWPDCDAQVDKGGHVLPEAMQPGVKAAEAIAKLLADSAAAVRIVRIPRPGAKPSGWDVADAIAADGWTREQLLEFLKSQQRSPGNADDTSTQRDARASFGEEDPWARTREHRLIWQGKGLKDCRENAIYVLRDHPAWRDVLGADIFAKRIVMRKPSPLGHALGEEWTPRDSMRLGIWLQENVQLLMRSLDVIGDGVAFVAGSARFHPVCEFLDDREWDQESRVDTWAIKHLGAPDSEYVRRASRYFMINLVRRIYEPGCVMRSVIVLEGPQDKGKSTALRMLVRPWFSDTPFKVGDKDAYQQIQGIWLYEISELESFTRAEATAVKAFVSSTEDNFRAPYERQNEKHKRQTMFAATTNAVEYLKDWTGNTRFWPLPCGELIDFDGLYAQREQLLAEALQLYRAGERTYPTAEEQQRLFKPQQEQRLMAHPWLDVVSEWHDNEGVHRPEVSVRWVMETVLKLDLAKINPQGGEAQKVGQILHALGYSKRRASDQSRAWIWKRPDSAPAPVGDDDIPF